MNVTKLLETTDKTLFSFEILPPLKGYNINNLYKSIDSFMEFSPSYINITSHRDEVTYKEKENGLFEREEIRRRPGTVAVAAAIKYKYKIMVVPHMICSGFNKTETENALIDLNYLGINNLLLLRGDAPRKGEIVQKKAINQYALDLIGQVNKMNQGVFADSTKAKSFCADFTFGVAGYPEKHEEAPNFESDIYYLKQKVKQGAGYIVTQMFFDNQKYIEFVKKVRARGIDVPIVPGIKPVTLLNQLNVLPQVFKTEIPEALASELRKCKNDKEARDVGVEWTTTQCKELIEFGVPSLHFYTFLARKSVLEVAKQVF